VSFDSFGERHLAGLMPRRLSEVKRGELKQLRAEISAKPGVGNPTANRCLAFVRAVYNWAIDSEEYDGPNPAARLKDRLPEASRERYISEAELPLFFAALASVDQVWQDALTLSLLTGGRWMNVSAMRWSEIGADRFWRPRDSKNKSARLVIPMPTQAHEILNSRRVYLRPQTDDKGLLTGFVFPSATAQEGHIVRPQKAFLRIRKEAPELHDLRLHDLRRTWATHATGLGIPEQVIAAVLGHHASGVTRIYARVPPKTRMEATQAVADHIFALGNLAR